MTCCDRHRIACNQGRRCPERGHVIAAHGAMKRSRWIKPRAPAPSIFARVLKALGFH